MPEIILSLKGVTKRYGGVPAVSELDMAVTRGSITGFLGPNGAGKTTSLRMALGILRPDAGQVRLFGRPPSARTLDRVGFLPEERGIYRKMTAEQVIAFFARLKGVGAAEAMKRARDRLARFGLEGAGRKKIRELSKGMAQKVQIIAAMAHEPEFIILDEPFSGLDPVNQQVLESLIRAEAESGKTILFSTHVMEHAERLCDRIVLIARGKKVFDGRVDEALAAAPRRVVIETPPGEDVEALLSRFGAVVRIPGAEGAGQAWQVDLAPGAGAQEVLKACVEAGVRLARFEPARPHLHDAFVRLVAEKQPELA
ncbi:MAG: ATP-binding cassette domain-containing protein [Maricaulaceae bacterium]|nr:ATP-binding cassette domain-containing protein [Maricaulaceae bacterium]